MSIRSCDFNLIVCRLFCFPLIDDLTVASVSSDLGTCYYNSGKYELAMSLFQDALRINLLTRDRASLEVADALYKIASCHDSLCEYDKGEF